MHTCSEAMERHVAYASIGEHDYVMETSCVTYMNELGHPRTIEASRCDIILHHTVLILLYESINLFGKMA